MQANFDEESALGHWDNNLAQREEFLTRENYLAFERANSAGRVRFHGGGVTQRESRDTPAPRHREDADAIEQRCLRTWESDASVRHEFGTFAAYSAFEKANTRGLIRVMGRRNQTQAPGVPARAPSATQSGERNDDARICDRAFQKSRWDQSTGLQHAFPDFEMFFQKVVTRAMPTRRAAA